ncbi:type VII secretion target [Amycolatopsis nivea]
MSGFEVVIDAIEKSSGAAKRSAGGAQSVDLAGTLVGVAQGLPGGTAIEAARMLGDMWGRELLAWAKNMDEYADQLTAAARRYRTDDQAAAHDLRVIPVHGGPRPV